MPVMGTLSGHLSAFSQAMLTKRTRQTIDLSVSLCMQPFSLPYICLWGHSPPVGTMPMVRPSLAVPNWFAHFTCDCRIVSHLIPYCHSLLCALTKMLPCTLLSPVIVLWLCRPTVAVIHERIRPLMTHQCLFAFICPLPDTVQLSISSPWSFE